MLKKANISWKENDTPENLDYGDVYFSKHNGLEESSYVFIRGNKLEQAWEDSNVFTIGELGFGTGLNFLNTIRHWIQHRLEGSNKSKVLNYISFEKYPLEIEVINQALKIWPELDFLRERLVESLPNNLPGLHRINFPEYKVFLKLYYGDANHYLDKITNKVDAWYLDGFAPSKNPELWSEDIFKKIASKSSAGASTATFSAARVVKDGLSNAGFEISLEKGFGRKRDMLVSKFKGSVVRRTMDRKIAIIGAGLAGGFSALSLAQRGIKADVYEQNSSSASLASGAAAGVLMPYLSSIHDDRSEFFLNSHDFTWRQVKDLENIYYSKCGVIRLAIGKTQEKAYQNFDNLNLDTNLAQAFDSKKISDLLGIEVKENGFYFPNSGWINPRELCSFLLKESNLILNTKVSKIEKNASGFILKNIKDEVLGEYEKVIICNAFEAKEFYPEIEVNLNRGQMVFVKTKPELSKLKHVFCHRGYLMPENNGMHLVGASYDHKSLSLEEDKEQSQELIDKLKSSFGQLEVVNYRVGFRTTTKDRMPIVKEIESGVFLNIGHGSRGLVSASECAERIVDQLII